MNKGFRLLVVFLALFSSHFVCKASVVSKSTHSIGFFAGKNIEKPENHNIYYAILNPYGSAQITRPETQRSLSFGKVLFSPNIKYRNELTSISYNFYAGNSGHERLRHLILFPFHAFW